MTGGGVGWVEGTQAKGVWSWVGEGAGCAAHDTSAASYLAERADEPTRGDCWIDGIFEKLNVSSTSYCNSGRLSRNVFVYIVKDRIAASS